jgi:hypothetical protein
VGGNLEGDLSGRGPLYRISLKQFEAEVAPTLKPTDCVCVVLLLKQNHDYSVSSSNKHEAAAAAVVAADTSAAAAPYANDTPNAEEDANDAADADASGFASLQSAVATARRFAGDGLQVVGLGAAMVSTDTKQLWCRREQQHQEDEAALAVATLRTMGKSLGCQSMAAVAVPVPPSPNFTNTTAAATTTPTATAATTSTATTTSSSCYDGPGVLCLKLMLNSVSTYAQAVGKGAVFHGRMICTGPTNDKIYGR